MLTLREADNYHMIVLTNHFLFSTDMYLLALLTIIGAAFAGPVAIPSTQLLTAQTEAQRAAAYVLPRDTIPTFYDVILHLNPDNDKTFTGSVDIRIIPKVSTNQIIMHAMELDIKAEDIEVFSDRAPTVNIFESHTLADNDTHLFSIIVKQEMTVLQPHTIRIKHYVAKFAENMFGVYLSTYSSDGTTQ